MRLKLLVLLVLRSAGVFALARWCSRRRAHILCYHGGCLGDEDRFNAKLFCRPALLEQRLRWLLRHGYRPATLDQVLDGQAGQRAVAITLDDGWYSSGAQLIPLLHRLGFPSTLYLATEVFAAQRPVHGVVLGYLLWKAPRRQIHLQGLDSAIDGAYALADAIERRRLAAAASRWLQGLQHDAAALRAALERLAQALGVSDLDLNSRRFSYLNAEELLALGAQSCSIQSHGHRHHYPLGDRAAFRDDLRSCSAVIESQGLPAPRHYCYPSGSFDAQAATVLRELGMSSATTCLSELPADVGAADRRYYLPRFLDGASVSQLEFEAELSGLMAWMRRLRPRPRLSTSRAVA